MRSSVVFPQPEGPTIAKVSRFCNSNEIFPITERSPYAWTMLSSTMTLSLITPPNAGNSRESHEHAIDDYADEAYRNHGHDEQIHAKPVSRVPNRMTQAVLTAEHFRSHEHEP